MDPSAKLLAELKYWLDREGIVLPPERIAGALADYIDVRHHVDVVAAALPQDEPATVLVLRSPATPNSPKSPA